MTSPGSQSLGPSAQEVGPEPSDCWLLGQAGLGEHVEELQQAEHEADHFEQEGEEVLATAGALPWESPEVLRTLESPRSPQVL